MITTHSRWLSTCTVALLSLAAGCGGRSNGGTTAMPPTTSSTTAVCGDSRCSEGEECPGDCLGIEWIAIEGGTYSMGSDAGPENERPLRSVSVEAFSLMKQEATVRIYRACTKAGACSQPQMSAGDDLTRPEYCSWMYDDREDHPINCISWDQARDLCRWLGTRLPTEAEWEYAARSRGQDVAFPWGDERPTCDLSVMGMEPHFIGCGEERTFPVCSKSRGNTAQGLCDMAGSVIEWVEDEAHESYEGAPSDGSAWIDSQAPTSRMARGGSLATRDPSFLRTTVRFSFEASQPRYVVGVRCAR